VVFLADGRVVTEMHRPSLPQIADHLAHLGA
jgi:hypothetical protein